MGLALRWQLFGKQGKAGRLLYAWQMGRGQRGVSAIFARRSSKQAKSSYRALVARRLQDGSVEEFDWRQLRITPSTVSDIAMRDDTPIEVLLLGPDGDIRRPLLCLPCGIRYSFGDYQLHMSQMEAYAEQAQQLAAALTEHPLGRRVQRDVLDDGRVRVALVNRRLMITEQQEYRPDLFNVRKDAAPIATDKVIVSRNFDPADPAALVAAVNYQTELETRLAEQQQLAEQRQTDNNLSVEDQAERRSEAVRLVDVLKHAAQRRS
jgi:hypothetical protein